MLSARTLLSHDGIEIADVACRHAAGRGREAEQTAGHAIVFVRRGYFVRSVDGVPSLLDPTVAYCMNPGEEQRYDHPHPHGDDCTTFFLSPGLVASLWGGELKLPSIPLSSTPQIDLWHRMLLAGGKPPANPHALVELAIAMAGSALEQADASRTYAGRPATARDHRALADGAREALAASHDCSLPDLARALAVSPHHLSRVFRAVTGHTISRHRIRLRTRSALERLGDGERNLARLAADTGFTDQSHLCRALRQETGSTPSSLRSLLGPK